MKKIFQLVAWALAAAAVLSCVKEKDTLEGAPSFIIQASFPEESSAPREAPGSKASFTPSGNKLALAWQDGDKIRVINHANAGQHAAFTIKDGHTDHWAQFEGTVPSGDYFDIVCPGEYTSPQEALDAGSSLIQNGNGSTAHLKFTAKLENVAKADLGNIAFSDAWVAGHPGTSLKKGVIVKYVLTLPDAVTAPKKVVMTGIGADVTLNITGVSTTSDHVLTAYATCGWEDVPIPQFSILSVGVVDADGSFYAADINISASGKTLKAGYQNTINITDASLFTEHLFAGGDGSQSAPYLIASAKQLDNMHDDRIDPNTGESVLKHGERVYFRLIDDIDMADYLATTRWIPLNSVTPYDYIIDFDGDNHTIANFTCTYDNSTDDTLTQKDPSFFGVLYGSCYDVTFSNATITTTVGPCGVLGGYVGYGGKKAVVYNVHVSGSVTRTTSTDTHGTGGLAGIVVFAYIDSCSSEANVTANDDFVGGLIGRDNADASRIRNCWTSGTVYGNQKVGGIIGGAIRPETAIINCFSTATVDAMRFAGCIVGDACADAGSNSNYSKAATLTPDNVIKGCIAWQSSFATRDVRSPYVDSWGSGAIAGMTALQNYLTDCKRNPSLDTHWTEVNAVTPYDQENAAPGNPLVVNNPNTSTMKHYYPYHGKAATSTRLSTVAQSLGWSTVAWDLSGDIPVLTGAVQPDDPSEVPVSGDANVPAQSSFARAFPANGAVKDGLTYDVTEIEPGIRYYHGVGTCTASWMDSGTHKQEIYVVDFDLSNTDYEVKVVVASPAAVTSEVFRQTGAIAAINGAYENASVAIKGNMFLDTENEVYTNYPMGYPYSYMPNNTIGSTGVANWKNEGTFYCDGHQDVRIAFDAYDGGSTNNIGSNTKVKARSYMRSFYKLCTDNEPGFISSAPVLDANYTRFGQSFKDRYTNASSNSEEPKTHQSGAYPRTAVAIAYPDGDAGDPHLLLIVCDGRYADSAGAYGMSAYWLERLIANAFGPKYMLNLDGGGSSTMCVKDKGDEDTHVVNYPCDSDSKDSGKTIHTHAGERARDSFIVIVPTQ